LHFGLADDDPFECYATGRITSTTAASWASRLRPLAPRATDRFRAREKGLKP
jgi:hypothetical protein